MVANTGNSHEIIHKISGERNNDGAKFGPGNKALREITYLRSNQKSQLLGSVVYTALKYFLNINI